MSPVKHNTYVMIHIFMQVAFLVCVVRPAFEAIRLVLPATAATVLANVELARRHWAHCAAHQPDDMFRAPS